jgi:Flp pilus assembly protein TadG
MMEFAIVAPMLFALVFGIYDFGRGMSANVTVTNSAREGARTVATHATAMTATQTSPLGRFDTACPTGAPSYTTAPASGTAQGNAWRQMVNASLDMTRATMTVRFYKSSNDPAASGATADDTITCSSGSLSESSSSYTPQSGDWVQFEIRYQYAPVTPIISSIVPTVTVDQVTTMVIE